MPSPITIVPTKIPEVLVLESKIFGDDRGYFTEWHSIEMCAEAGFHETFCQDNLSKSAKGTLRGLHYQIEPRGIGKLVRAVTGSVFDVAVDIRRGSPTFGQWVGETLTEKNGRALWVPVGFAHGFVALEEETRVFYKCTGGHAPECERSLLWNDPAIGIEWPIEPTNLSPKDEQAPPLEGADFNFQYGGSNDAR